MEVISQHVPILQPQTSPKKIVRALVIAGAGALIATKLYALFLLADALISIYTFLTTFLIFSSFIITYTMYKDPVLSKRKVLAGGTSSYIWNPLVSVVIPAKNDPVMIVEAAKSCLDSTYQNIELILVNDGSTDNTGHAMDAIRKQFPDKVRVIHLEKNIGKKKAMREGIISGPAKGELILFVDSDCIVEKTAIEKLVSVFEDPDVGAVSGLGRAVNANQNALTKMQDTWYDGQYSIMKATESAFGSVTCLPGILSLYRKEAIMPALDQWADDKFLGAEFSLGDDRHLTSYVIGGNKHYIDKNLKVWKTVYTESALVYTEVPHSFKKFLWQQIRWQKSWLRVFLFTAPYFYKNRNPFMAALYYLQMVWSFISPVVAVHSLVLLPLQGQYWSAIVYLAGLLLVGLLFAAEFRLRNPHSGGMWAYRLPLAMMGLFLTSIQFYSFLTVKNKNWLTR